MSTFITVQFPGQTRSTAVIARDGQVNGTVFTTNTLKNGDVGAELVIAGELEQMTDDQRRALAEQIRAMADAMVAKLLGMEPEQTDFVRDEVVEFDLHGWQEIIGRVLSRSRNVLMVEYLDEDGWRCRSVPLELLSVGTINSPFTGRRGVLAAHVGDQDPLSHQIVRCFAEFGEDDEFMFWMARELRLDEGVRRKALEHIKSDDLLMCYACEEDRHYEAQRSQDESWNQEQIYEVALHRVQDQDKLKELVNDCVARGIDTIDSSDLPHRAIDCIKDADFVVQVYMTVEAQGLPDWGFLASARRHLGKLGVSSAIQRLALESKDEETRQWAQERLDELKRQE